MRLMNDTKICNEILSSYLFEGKGVKVKDAAATEKLSHFILIDNV